MTTLFEITNARTTDPPTSRLSARKAARGAAGHKAAILQWLAVQPEPRNFHEIAKGVGLSAYAVGKRVSDLWRDGRIEPVGELGGARTWRLTLDGHHAIGGAK
jgi:predicted transcriptional regulator